MRTREKTELGLIAVVAALAWFFAAKFPARLSVGYLILAGAVLLLGQGLLRDLWIKFGAGRDHPAANPEHAASPKTAPPFQGGENGGAKQQIVCMCMESTVGVAGVIGGLAVLLCGLGRPVEVALFFWPALVLAVGITGFVIKDFVLDWKARSVRRVKDHQSIIPW